MAKKIMVINPLPLRGMVRERGKLPLYQQVVATPTPNPSRKGRGVFLDCGSWTRKGAKEQQESVVLRGTLLCLHG
jgi:hypothetical protein